MSDFLPQDYAAPSGGGGYMKFHPGENKIRILSRPILGWLDWKDKTPHRFQFDKKPSKSLGDKPIRHFWAMLVWNYNEGACQILEITQATIQTAIQDLYKDSDWGEPYNYDIKITKTGENLDTKYAIIPGGRKPLDPEIIKVCIEKKCDLTALFRGADPWDVQDGQIPTPIETSELPF